MGSELAKRSTRNGKKKKRNKALMRELRQRAVTEVENRDSLFRDVSPEDALQTVLNNAHAMMLFYEEEAGKVKKSELWRDTISGRIPHEAIRAAQQSRAEVAHLAGRAIDLGLELRKVNLAERNADILTVFIESVMNEVGLNPAQRRKLGPAIRLTIANMAQEPSPAAEEAA